MKNAKKIKEELLCPPRVGEIVEGTVVGREKNSVFVDLGAIGVGVIYGRELKEARNLMKDLKNGNKISAKVIGLETDDGYRELSVKDASLKLNWNKLKDQKEREEILEVKIMGANKGGLLTRIMGIPAFLPASQLAPEHYPKVEKWDPLKILKALQKFIGETFKVKISNLSQENDKLILSEKINHEDSTTKNLTNYKVGEVVEGEITGITAFGVFLKFGKENLEGLVHASEIPQKGTKSKLPTENLKVGEKKKAKILAISGNRVFLSFKGL